VAPQQSKETSTMTDDTAQPGATISRPRRSRRSASAAGSSTRARRPRPSGEDLVAQLTAMVDKLIAENRELKRAIARIEKSPVGGGLGEATRALSGLQRRVSRALGGDGGRGRRGAAEAPAPRPRRKVTDPEILERRRAALAKARAARAAKRAAGGA
jgi:hypothetical protein